MGNTVASRARLANGAAELGVELDEAAQQVLMSYLALLKRWNKVYNLTAIKGDDNMLTRHLLDSLSVVSTLQGSSSIDIGSGAGLPGIPVAIARPDMQVTLLDSNAKRCRFLRQVQAQLKLTNLSIVQRRVEEYQPAEKFDNLLSRAFSSLQVFISSSAHLLAEGGQFIAMKGAWPGDETVQLENAY
ncbi:MAG: 16S rRNA (guanine(527)-N(7))-methyltransferase RsmG, partial [Gammaproteobacteria bacterium]|nr:16S rRNA (guanine(527)-N(7))-methyltransferase RsmG [Gammaproteobacteria bacterium]